jgi:uncharacterized protein (TIGR02996 family)
MARMATPHDKAFLADILEHPEDDTPRLIYADWLTDHGQPDRGEFIRVQIERSRLDEDDLRQDELERREQHLLAKHTVWFNDVPKWARRGAIFRRGFLYRVSVTEREILKGAALWRTAPIRSLILGGLFPNYLAVFHVPQLARVLDLAVHSYLEDDAVADLGASPVLTNLERLSLSGCSLRPEHVEVLLEGALGERLLAVDLGNNRLDLEGVYALMEREDLCQRLRHLDLWGACPNDGNLATVLARVPWPNLRTLRLGHADLSVADLQALAGGAFPALRELDLSATAIPPMAFRKFLASDTGQRLTALDLSQNESGGLLLDILLQSPGLENLRHLTLGRLDLCEKDLHTLAGCARLSRLTRLDLYETTLSVASVTALVSSPNLRGLRRLGLNRTSLGAGVVAALADHLALPILGHLSLGGSGITEQGLTLLTSAPRLARLVSLDLNDPGDAYEPDRE